MSLETAIGHVIATVPECVAAGVVNVAEGVLVGVKVTDGHPQEGLGLAAAATGDLFHGGNISAIEDMFDQARWGTNDSHHNFREIIVYNDNLVHIFQRGSRDDGIVMIAVCRRSANLGIALVKARGAMGVVEAEM